ncbi:MAG: MMPL family transporter [Thermoanaerobaculia bacterium]|nr:MMPL family transporter [Thermoanaerobaculia bacterium]
MRSSRRAAWGVLALFAALLAGASPGLPRLRLDSSPQVFFVRDAERLAEYRRLVESFGSLESVRLVVQGEDLWSPEALVYLEALETAAREVPGVRQTAGAASRYAWLEPGWPPGDLGALRTRVAADPLVGGAGWLDAGEGPAAVDLLLEPGARRELGVLRERLLRVPRPAGVTFDLVGLPVVQEAFDTALARLVWRNFPVLGLLVIALLVWRLGGVREAVAPLLFVAAVEATLLGALGLLGIALNLVNVVLVALLFVISAATAIHLQHAFLWRRRAGEGTEAAVEGTLRRKSWAVTWAALSTAIAFGSFVASPMPPIRSLGIWLGVGMLWMLVCARLLYPALLLALFGGRGAVAGRPRRRGPEIAVAAAALAAPRRTRAVFAISALLLAAGVLRIRQESGLLSYLGAEDPVRQAIERADEAGLGVVTAELVLRAGELRPGFFRDPDRLEELLRLSGRLRADPDVRGAVGAGDLFAAGLDDAIVEGEATPAARWLVLGLLQSSGETRRLLDLFLSREGEAARLTLFLPLADHRRLEPVLARARARAEHLFPGLDVEITGELPLILVAQRRLLSTLAASLGLTVALIALLLAALLRSPRLAARVLVANLWPVAAVFGAMGWLGIALDVTTVMGSAVVLGLALDDSLHTLAEVRAARGGRDGVGAALSAVAPAHLLTSLVLILGFAVCAVSELAQTSRFCVLVAIGCGAALASDLGLLPVLLADREGGAGEEGQGTAPS